MRGLARPAMCTPSRRQPLCDRAGTGSHDLVRKFVFFVALGVLAWIFVVPSCSTKFGCESAAAVAHADSGDCPSDVDEAAHDARWAADRLAAIAAEPETVGLFYDSDGAQLEFDSSHDEDEKRATK